MEETEALTNGNGAEAGTGLVFGIGEQFVRDFSFENPAGARGASALANNPNVAIEVKTEAKSLENDLYEVSLLIRAEATVEERPVFIVELVYAGLFQVGGVPPEEVRPVVMIEGPRHLFPFARAIVSNMVREGGFPPLMIEPIDFASLYFNQEAQQQAN